MQPNENTEPRAAGEAAQKELALFLTTPHGAQELVDLLKQNDPSETPAQRLYALRDIVTGDEPTEIWLTGEELDSLARQWLTHRGDPREAALQAIIETIQPYDPDAQPGDVVCGQTEAEKRVLKIARDALKGGQS